MTTARQAVAAAMSEAALQAMVVELAERLGYERPYHTHDSRRSEPGFPDLVMLRLPKPGRTGRLVFVELKREDGRLSEAQTAWLIGLKMVGADVHVFRPSDWKSGEIERCLG